MNSKSLINKRTFFYDKKIEIDEYLRYLALLSDSYNIDLTIHKNLRKLIAVIKQEKNIDFKKSNSERIELIDELSKRLSSLELETFVKKTSQFKNEEIKAREFYSYLLKKAETTGISAKKAFPNLLKYRKYIETYETLNSHNLFSEIEALEEELFSELCENKAQKELCTLSKNLAILNKLFNVTLTSQEYKDYSLSFSPSLSSPHKRESHEKIPTLNTYKTKMEEFYTLAFKRDSAFLRNIKDGLKDKDKLIVVTGGFHTENLKMLLKEKGYSYFSIMPKLDKKDEENPYFKLLSGGLIEEERIVTQAMSSIALGSMFDDMDEAPLGDDSISRQAVALRVGSESGKVFSDDIRPKPDENDNVTCGTVCRPGHEECIGALDDQLEEFYEDLAKKAGIVRDLKINPLSSEEVLNALIQTGRIKSDTAELLKRIKANLEEIEEKGIQILFAVPKDKTKLWWVKDPETGVWTYAGGHFNGKGTRIHISLPLILSQDDPEGAATAIAMHDYKHILGMGHDEDDEGMRIVTRAAVLERDWENVIKRHSISRKVDKNEDDAYDRFKEELILIRQAMSSIFSGEMFDDVDEVPTETDDTDRQTVVAPETEHVWLSDEVVEKNSLLQWAKDEWTNIVIIAGCIVGMCVLLPKLVSKIRKHGLYPVNIQQKKNQEYKEYSSRRVASQIIDPSLVPKPRHEETVEKKFPQDWNTNIDNLAVTKTSGIGGTQPWHAPLANETIVAGIEGKIYGPLFKTISFNFKSNGENSSPERSYICCPGGP